METTNSHFLAELLDHVQSDAFYAATALTVAFVAYAFIGSLITGDLSYVDRQWSVIPAFHAWIYVYFSNSNVVVTLFAVLITIWSIRLTANFARKGGYAGVEDYRWQVLRESPYLQNKFVFLSFNLGFICCSQHFILLFISRPLYCIIEQNVTELQVSHVLIAGVMVLALVVEAVADEQQWAFQTEKYRQMEAKVRRTQDYARGFLSTGLFRFSRHPNFFAEQWFWFNLYVLTIVITGSYFNWYVVGIVALMGVFHGSSNFTESITASKYPKYRVYQAKVSRMFPMYSSPVFPPSSNNNSSNSNSSTIKSPS